MGLVQNIFCWNLAVHHRALVLTNMADDDYDMEVERDPDEPEYYQAKEADFVSQVFEDSKKNESKSDEEPEPESELESEDVNLRDYRLKGQVCLQVLIPDWICNLFSMKMENPKTLAYCILALLFPAILAIIASFWVFPRIGIEAPFILVQKCAVTVIVPMVGKAILKMF